MKVWASFHLLALQLFIPFLKIEKRNNYILFIKCNSIYSQLLTFLAGQAVAAMVLSKGNG